MSAPRCGCATWPVHTALVEAYVPDLPLVVTYLRPRKGAVSYALDRASWVAVLALFRPYTGVRLRGPHDPATAEDLRLCVMQQPRDLAHALAQAGGLQGEARDATAGEGARLAARTEQAAANRADCRRNGHVFGGGEGRS